MAYFFPGVMYRRLIDAKKQNPKVLQSITIDQSLRDAYTLYEFCTQQYLGLGSLVQFIPGTNQNRARRQLLAQLEPTIVDAKESIEDAIAIAKLKTGPLSALDLIATRATFSSYLNFKHFFLLLDLINDGFTSNRTRNTSYRKIKLITAIPFLSRMLEFNYTTKLEISFKKDKYTRLLESIVNPAIPIHSALNFIHILVHMALDACNKYLKDSNFSFVPNVVRVMVNLVFGLVKIPVIVAGISIGIALDVVDAIVINPLLHLAKSLKLAYHNIGNSFFMATADEFHQAKQLRQVVKNRTPDFTTQPKIKRDPQSPTKEYIATKKGVVYSNDIDKETLVAVSGPRPQISETKGLIAIVGTFKSHGNKNIKVHQHTSSVSSAEKIVHKKYELRDFKI